MYVKKNNIYQESKFCAHPRIISNQNISRDTKSLLIEEFKLDSLDFLDLENFTDNFCSD